MYDAGFFGGHLDLLMIILELRVLQVIVNAIANDEYSVGLFRLKSNLVQI